MESRMRPFGLKSLLLVGLLGASLALTGCASDGTDGAPGADADPAVVTALQSDISQLQTDLAAAQADLAVATDPAAAAAVQAQITALQAELDAALADLAAANAAIAAANTASASSESCAVCHDDVAGQHAGDLVSGDAVVSDVAVAAAGADLAITFNVETAGVARDDYTIRRGYAHYEDPALAGRELTAIERSNNVRASLSTDDMTLVSDGSGDYTLTIAAASVFPNATYLFQLDNADETRPIVVAENGTPPLRDLVDQSGCTSCHGSYVFPDSHYTVDSKYCQVCHVRDGRSFYIANQLEDGSWDVDTNAGDGGNLPIYVHGVHNSHHMPAGEAYFHGEEWSIGYPSDMRNCSVCHTSDDQLDAAVTAPVSYYLCMSCHQDWDGFVDHDGNKIMADDSFHRGMDISTACMTCHSTSAAFDEAADFHNFFSSDDAHYNSLYRGVDISFANPTEVNFGVTSVTKSGSDVTFTWTATKGGVAVNPCNTDIDSGPTFASIGAYLAYAKGDDWVNEGVSTTPGQPLSARNLFTSLATTCTSNVATTTGLQVSAAAPADTTKALLALGGKPQDKHSTGNAFYVRVPSPTYAFSMTDGAAAAARRDIVDSTKCTGCHAGTMYQHGGDRIDNAQLCVICHNPASNDKNNRMDRFQIVNEDGTVDTSSTYDGKTAQTYDLRYLLHNIHGVNLSGTPYVVYRSRGIYAFVTGDTEEPTGWPADGMTIYGSDNDSTIAHNWTVVHYPQALTNCEACHNSGTYEVADQTKAVALTTDAGTNWPDQSDDTVIGPNAAACTSCHNTAPVRAHAEMFGYKANVTKDAMLDAAE